jgi:molybdopterin-guanine dinucleotide biosynthesis protein A
MRSAILAGGGATRFEGKPKGLEQVGGTRILDRLVGVLAEAFGRDPLLVANQAGASSWRAGLRVVADLVPGHGVLSGIHTAVREAPAPVVCVAWDMPFVTVPLLHALAEGLNDADACLPESDNRRGVEPLCAAYGPACGPAIERVFETGDRRAIAFHHLVRIGILNGRKVSSLGDPAVLFFNVNTAEDLARAEELARS